MLSLAVLLSVSALRLAGDPLDVASPLPAFAQDPEMVPEAPPEEDQWEFALGVFVTAPPDDDAYVSPTLYADRGQLHLEARWNYEALDTGSIFAGWCFSGSDELAVEFTPMLGGVFGDTSGIAPAFELDLAWKQLEFYSEAEYVFDLEDGADDFFYAWSTLTWSPLEWLHTGLVGERTRVYDSGLDVNRGLLLGVSYENFALTVYGFNLDADAYVKVELGIGF